MALSGWCKISMRIAMQGMAHMGDIFELADKTLANKGEDAPTAAYNSGGAHTTAAGSVGRAGVASMSTVPPPPQPYHTTLPALTPWAWV